MQGTTNSPFGDAPLAEIPLRDAPLVRVLCQVRFPHITSISRESFIGEFQEAIRSQYPVLRPERELGLVMSPEGVAPASDTPTIWRFQDRPGEWKISLAPTFMALETSRYSSRDDFLERLTQALEALGEHIRPELYERLGIRYVDRLETPDALLRLRDFIRDEILGVVAAAEPSSLEHHLSQTQFAVDDSHLTARWGVLPPGSTHEPSISPAPERSFVLDLDMFETGEWEFDRERLISRARLFSSRIYRFFRWAVTRDFLVHFGADETSLNGAGWEA
jgi:uncharacterized protein (TIGR04255 family)